MPGGRPPPKGIRTLGGREIETGPFIHARGPFQGTKIEPGIVYSRGSKINIGPTGKTALLHGQEIPTGPQVPEAVLVGMARQGTIINKHNQKSGENVARTIYPDTTTLAEERRLSNEKRSSILDHALRLKGEVEHFEYYEKISNKQIADKTICCQELLEVSNNAISNYGPDDVFYHAKEDALKGLKRYDEAIKAYDKSIELDPKSATAHTPRTSKIKIFLSLNKFNEAITECDKGEEIEGSTFLANDFIVYRSKALKGLENKWFDLGYKSTDPKEQIEYYDKVIELNPKKDAAWHNKGLALSNLDKHEEAIKSYDEAIKLDPKYDKSWSGKGRSLNQLNKNEDAIKCLDQALELNPKNGAAWDSKGNALKGLNKFEQAISCFDKALELNPNINEAWHNKGLALSKLNKHEEALKCYDQAFKLDPNDITIWHNKRISLEKLGNYEEAKKIRIMEFLVMLVQQSRKNNKSSALKKLTGDHIV